MSLEALLESLKVEALGIAKYGFIDGIEPVRTYSSSFSSSCSSTNNESTSLLSNMTMETHPTSDALFSSSDFSVEPVTMTVVTNTGNEHLPGTCAYQDKVVDGKSNLLDNPNSNISIIGHVCKATKEDTCRISYPHLGLFNGDKNIWCNCIENSQSSWDYEYDLGDNLESLTNNYPPSETDDGAENSILNNCTSKTAEDYDIDTLDFYFDSDNGKDPGTCAYQDKVVDGKSNLLDNPNSNISIIGHVCKATKEDTCRISYPHLGLFNGGKNIWCNCIENSQSSWDYEYDLGDNLESLTNNYPPSETDDEAENSILNNCTSKTAEDYDIDTLDFYFDSDNEDYQYKSSSQIYGPASPKGKMPVCGSLSDKGSSSREKSTCGLVNNEFDYGSLLGDYMHLMYNRFDPKMSDMLALTPDKLLHLMTDPDEWSAFKELIPFYTKSHLKLIVSKISANYEKLIKTACNEIGCRSLQGLIKKLKKLNLAMPITQALSPGCKIMMIHNFGRRVIQQCFTYLDANENKPLYEEVIRHCVELSTHKIGCLSLNECIDTIIGSQRDILLDAISDRTLYLSFQSYGTFVIQHVLQLRNPKFNDKICQLLIGNYASLSQVYRGSHLVEKCLQFSNLGLFYLMAEIQTRQGMLEILAIHEFGNYVIQQAVTISKRTNTSYYGYLINNLLPLMPLLENIKYGKKLANLLRDQLTQERL